MTVSLVSGSRCRSSHTESVPPQIRLAAASNADEVARILAAGFAGDPVMSWMFGSARQAEKLDAFFTFLANEALVPLGATFVLDGSCASWTPPNPPEWPDDRSARYATALGAVCDAGDFERMQILGDIIDNAHPAQPYWYLSTLATVPEQRGHGLGGQLLQHMLMMLDADQAPAYLESTNPRNVSLYERHGFRATGLLDLPDGPSLIPMWREPVDRVSPG
jgi:ribosomal protein S18 acetylase RimI-like enzyme